MHWQEVAVASLLVLSILCSKLFRAFPRDLIFAIAALSTSLLGIVSSKQIFAAAVSQAILAVFGLWLLAKAMQYQGFFKAIANKIVLTKKGKHFGRFVFY